MVDQIADKEAVASMGTELPEDVDLAGDCGSSASPKDAAAAKDGARPWTQERVEQLSRLWLEGLSASRIASELAGGVTRNAVIGKVHRLGLSGRVKAPAGPRSKPVKPVEAAVPQRPVSMPVRGSAAVAVQHRPAMPLRCSAGEDRVVSMVENVTIMDLRESMCRWPVGDPSSSEFRYCGGKAPIGEGPYCKLHSRMAYQPTQDRRPRKIA